MKSSTSSNNWPSDVSSEENNVKKHLSHGFCDSLQPTSPQSSLPSTSLVLTQVHRSLFQHATAVLVPPLDESLLVSVSWQVCFFLTSCEPVRMHCQICYAACHLLMPATGVSPLSLLRRSGCSTLQLVNHGIFPTDQHAPAFGSH